MDNDHIVTTAANTLPSTLRVHCDARNDNLLSSDGALSDIIDQTKQCGDHFDDTQLLRALAPLADPRQRHDLHPGTQPLGRMPATLVDLNELCDGGPPSVLTPVGHTTTSAVTTLSLSAAEPPHVLIMMECLRKTHRALTRPSVTRPAPIGTTSLILVLAPR